MKALPVTVWLLCAVITEQALAQGSLTPPAGPAPLMKTLQQIEPRTPIDNAHTPGGPNYEFVINQPGSYYLTGNLPVTKADGIRVSAPGVTIDLNGFEIRRISGAGGSAIEIAETADRCTVANGSINGGTATFEYGVETLGITPPQGGVFRGLFVTGCSAAGLEGGSAWRAAGKDL
jgi:hypothetical protein